MKIPITKIKAVSDVETAFITKIGKQSLEGRASRLFNVTADGSPPIKIVLKGEATIPTRIMPSAPEAQENFDWSNGKNKREFIRLEQKVLADKSTAAESNRYRKMKQDRNSHIFADRCLRDYAEVERLKALSQKLAEIQHYLKPIGALL